ncbi:MAG: hypothetical protein ABI270_05555 [Nitrosospira sp.]
MTSYNSLPILSAVAGRMRLKAFTGLPGKLHPGARLCGPDAALRTQSRLLIHARSPSGPGVDPDSVGKIEFRNMPGSGFEGSFTRSTLEYPEV